jgi:hypothetical protein
MVWSIMGNGRREFQMEKVNNFFLMEISIRVIL